MQRFSDEWARAWARALDSDPDYRRHAERWEGGILFVVRDISKVYLDLHRGRCREGREATADDEAAAPFALEADLPVWSEVLDGRLDPIYALMRGKLKLSRGSLAALLPYTAAAKAMVRVAGSLEGP